MQNLDAKVESLIRDLPDEKGARLFLERVATEQPRTFQKLTRDPALLSDALALAAWSPLLATTLEQNPDYVSWLKRERADVRVRTRDQLKESLARFALTHSSLTPQVLFARFRRRELLRIYLHDVRRAHTLVETTEELSNLADAILDYALSLARQDLDNRYGAPLHDERGRIATGGVLRHRARQARLMRTQLRFGHRSRLHLFRDDGTHGARRTGERGEQTQQSRILHQALGNDQQTGGPSGGRRRGVSRRFAFAAARARRRARLFARRSAEVLQQIGAGLGTSGLDSQPRRGGFEFALRALRGGS